MHLIEEHSLLIITGVQASGVIIDRLLRQCCFVWSEIVGTHSSGNFNDHPPSQPVLISRSGSGTGSLDPSLVALACVADFSHPFTFNTSFTSLKNDALSRWKPNLAVSVFWWCQWSWRVAYRPHRFPLADNCKRSPRTRQGKGIGCCA